MVFKRQTYRCLFWNGEAIRVSAINDKQATIIANAIGAKHGWKLQQVGIVPR